MSAELERDLAQEVEGLEAEVMREDAIETRKLSNY